MEIRTAGTGPPEPSIDSQIIFQVIGGPATPELGEALRPQDPRFVSCEEAAQVQMRFAGATKVRSLRVVFGGVFVTEVRDSWLRGPQLPPEGSLSIDSAQQSGQELRWLLRDQAGLPAGVLVELRIPEQELTDLTLRLPAGRFALLSVSAAATEWTGETFVGAQAPRGTDFPGSADSADFPPSQADLPRQGDAFGAALSQGGDVSPEALWRLALPYRAGALIGAYEGPIVSVNWDGGVIVQNPKDDGTTPRIWFRLGEMSAAPDAPPADPGVPGARAAGLPGSLGLLDGWLPVAQVESGAITQTTLVDRQGRLHIRWRGLSAPPHFLAQGSGNRTADNAPRMRIVESRPIALAVPAPGQTENQTEGGLRIGPLSGTLTATADSLDLMLPLGDTTAPRSFDDALADVRAFAEGIVQGGARLELPDARLHNLWRALQVHNHLFIRQGKLRYGVFPSLYDGAIFGVEEGWNIVALALYGHGALAQQVLSRTFFEAEFLKKEGQHHQYRNGLALTYALDVYRLTGDKAWLRSLWPTILDSAEWIVRSLRSTQVLVNGQRPPYYGLMPKHTYGGDVREPAYSLYGSSACWRGLRDAALIAGLLDDPHAGELATEADAARENMARTAHAIFRADAHPPYLPFAIDSAQRSAAPSIDDSANNQDPPSVGDYHQLFASLVLETALFGWQGPLSRSITDYLEITGRQVCGAARFDPWFGRLGVDAEYSRGTQLAHLHRRDFDRFWLGLVGQIGLSCDPFTFVSPETAIVRFSRRDHLDRMCALAGTGRLESDPCSAGTAVMLQYLRYLLVFEERDEDDQATGTILVAAAAPATFFAPGTGFAALDLPTAQGRLSLRCAATADSVRYDLETAGPLTLELFYFDAAGTRRSVRRDINGKARCEIDRDARAASSG